ncbi:MAG: hypothetical protein HYS12_02780 [Planctomycetes bacterium]|nr:hypothetical protein [Planctomycetota bacterium]
MEDIRRNVRVLPMRYPGRGTLRIECTYPRQSKPLIDDIDRALAFHFGFTDEELDFLVHFDAKYRLGTVQAEQPLGSLFRAQATARPMPDCCACPDNPVLRL